MSSHEDVTVANRSLRLTSGDRVMITDGPTKRGLVDHWVRVGELAHRWAPDRPLSLKRAPDGAAGEAFFQKNAPSGLPDWIASVDLERRDGTALSYVVLSEPAALAALVQMGTVEVHADAAAAATRDRLSEIVLDLDPPSDAPVAVVRGATHRVLDLCRELDLPTRVKLSGSSGYHVHVGLVEAPDAEPDVDAGRARQLSHDLADLLVALHPGELTIERRVEDRGERVLVDWWRNTPGATTVLVWSPRIRPGAPVAAPISVEEVDELTPTGVPVKDVGDRLSEHGDPWEGIEPAVLDTVEDAVATAREDVKDIGRD